MFSWIEICLISAAAALLVLRALPYFQSYRPLLRGGAVLFLITALFPRSGNPVGQFLFGGAGHGLQLPREFFGIVWWILGAWLLKNVLDLVLSRTLFPDNDEPHARRLFADLASGLIYVLAFIGIVGTVFKEPVSTFLTTSGVLAIVLGLALQNTLGDVFSGLAINIERPFGAGDWISMANQVSGQVMQVNWRATRLRTWAHDMVIVPNSVISKSIVTNHSRPVGPHRCIIHLKVDLTVAPARVIGALNKAALDSPDVAHGTIPRAYAWGFSDSLVEYELAFALDNFALTPRAKSDMLGRIASALLDHGIAIGTPAMEVRIIERGDSVAANAVPNTTAASQTDKI
jgi:small-conductance mechanosensitive channel